MITALAAPPNFVVVEDISPYLTDNLVEKLNDISWSDIVFTTFSICDTGMLEYEITSDGFLYLTEEDGSLRKLDTYTGEIEFDTLIPGSEKDYEISFKAIFYKGDLKSLTAEKVKEHDSRPRLEARDKISEMVKAKAERSNKWWYKLYVFYTEVVVFILTAIRWVFGSLIKLCWIIQNKIT